jgi:hypothetical protein
MKLYVCVQFLLVYVVGDVYMQTPPGANNRLDEQNRERANANRLCDTQNNNRGGYNVGKMEYYKGEKVPIGWTQQHGSSKYQMEHSELIIQYMYSPLIRDGTTTRTIPIKATECQNYDCDTDVRFGRHESLDFYEMCTQTEQNQGLFTANQNLKGPSARFTRQNNQGTRNGYECPEERDYYPYWRPSPWIDAAYITADTAKCSAIQAESQNVKERYECRLPEAFFDNGGTLNKGQNSMYPLNKEDCEAFTKTDGNGTDHTGVWNTIPAHGVAAPLCQQMEQTRANHHGNPGGRSIYEHPWTVPDIPDGSQVVLRIRYNITTNEFNQIGAWETNTSVNAGVNATYNAAKNNPNPNNDRSQYPLWADYGLDEATGANEREYELINNPQVDAFGVEYGDGAIKLQLAVNTAQFGRGFQDRSHYFFVNDPPAGDCAGQVIKLQTVRGKRGNIVQTYPATEYIFAPEQSFLRAGDCVHFAWTGSNTNPNNNDGQGKQGTDRSNMVVLRTDQYDKVDYSNFEWDMGFDNGEADVGSKGNSYPSYVKQPEGYIIPDQFIDELVTEAFGGMPEDILTALATTRKYPHDFGNMEELDDAGTGFNMAPQKVTKQGCWNYMSTRNNNFSNRAQKGKFCVTEGDVGDIVVGSGGLEWWDSDGTSAVLFWPNSVSGMDNAYVNVLTTPMTNIVEVSKVNLIEDGTITVTVAYSTQALYSSQLVWQAEDTGEEDWDSAWHNVPFRTSEVNGHKVAIADVQATGTFKVINEPNVGPIAALAIAIAGFVLALCWVILRKMGYCGGTKPKQWTNETQHYGNTAVVNQGESGL